MVDVSVHLASTVILRAVLFIFYRRLFSHLLWLFFGGLNMTCAHTFFFPLSLFIVGFICQFQMLFHREASAFRLLLPGSRRWQEIFQSLSFGCEYIWIILLNKYIIEMFYHAFLIVYDVAAVDWRKTIGCYCQALFLIHVYIYIQDYMGMS